MINFSDWYTDTVDTYRVTSSTDGAITSDSRLPNLIKEPCRIYRTALSGIQMKPESATLQGNDKLMCDVSTDIKPGDELLVSRGGTDTPIRYFAGQVQTYFEPFGAVMPGLAHKEINLLQEGRT